MLVDVSGTDERQGLKQIVMYSTLLNTHHVGLGWRKRTGEVVTGSLSTMQEENAADICFCSFATLPATGCLHLTHKNILCIEFYTKCTDPVHFVVQ